jgi:hypothetical protein
MKMKRGFGLLLIVFLYGCSSLQGVFDNVSKGFFGNGESSTGNPSFVRQSVDFTIRDSVDKVGNLYISYQSQLPSIMTFVNSDGTVTVCSSDEKNKVTYIYEYANDLTLVKTLNFNNEVDQLGAFTKDDDGNYYFFYGEDATSEGQKNMALVKYDSMGNKKNIYTLIAYADNSYNGIQNPFKAGTCRMETTGNMLCVYFARQMFKSNDGMNHQASYGFVVNKDSFARLDSGQVTNSKATPVNRVPSRMQMPYVSHSFNQYILPIENGFIFADHGDAFPRCFNFAEFKNGENTKNLQAFKFAGQTGQNATYAEMGGLAKTSKGYIFAGAYGRDVNTSRNVFILTFDIKLSKCNNPLYITSYTKDDGHAGHPKIIALDNGRYLILWEKFKFSIQEANIVGQEPTGYQTTYMITIDENGKILSGIQELKGVRLNMNDVFRYNPKNGKVYWAINNSNRSITLYALDVINK